MMYVCMVWGDGRLFEFCQVAYADFLQLGIPMSFYALSETCISSNNMFNVPHVI